MDGKGSWRDNVFVERTGHILCYRHFWAIGLAGTPRRRYKNS